MKLKIDCRNAIKPSNIYATNTFQISCKCGHSLYLKMQRQRQCHNPASGCVGWQGRGELIMHSTSKSLALASFRITTKHFLIFTRYFLVDRVFLFQLCLWIRNLCVCSVTSTSPPPGLLCQPLPCSVTCSFVVDESSLQALCQDLQWVGHALAFRKRMSLFCPQKPQFLNHQDFLVIFPPLPSLSFCPSTWR